MCGKKYKGRDGLWRHQQKCIYFIENEDDDEYKNVNVEYDDDDDEIEVWKDMIKTLMDQNTEWQSKYTELQKTMI